MFAMENISILLLKISVRIIEYKFNDQSRYTDVIAFEKMIAYRYNSRRALLPT